MDPKDTPLQREKEQKSAELKSRNLPPDATTTDPEAPYGRFANGKPRKTPAGSSSKPKVDAEAAAAGSPPPEFDYEKSRKEGEFFLSMIESMRAGMGITRPINDMTRTAFIESIPAMEAKYGDSVSRYMPELMFFGSGLMIIADTIKELRLIKLAEMAELEKANEPD